MGSWGWRVRQKGGAGGGALEGGRVGGQLGLGGAEGEGGRARNPLPHTQPPPHTRAAGQAPVYAPTLVKALAPGSVAGVRSGQHHTLVLTREGES